MRNEFTVFDERIIVSPKVNDCARLFVPGSLVTSTLSGSFANAASCLKNVAM
jgi:hypothetical protein